jgi:pre-mycofactocin synthase
MAQRLEWARSCGAVGVILTLDWTFSNGRDWGSPVIPETMNLSAMVRYPPRHYPIPAGCGRTPSAARCPTSPSPTCANPGTSAPPPSSALPELRKVAEETGADAIIVGASASLRHRLFGSLGPRLLRRGPCPVTIVP